MNAKICFIDDVDSRLRALIGPGTIEESDMVRCDYVVYGQILWADPNTHGVLRRLDDLGASLGKMIIVFVVSDFELRYQQADFVFVFRTSLRASLLASNEYVLPYIWEAEQKSYPILQLNSKPIIGFCGLASKPRLHILNHFALHDAFQTKFIPRDKFWGGDPHNPVLVNDFRRNLEESHFIVANRGVGNFSMRFYQTLSAGRIPILIDTDVLLPFDEEVDWESSIVIGGSPEDLSIIIKNLCDASMVERMQERCGNIFEDHFRKGCFVQLLERIEYGAGGKRKQRRYRTRKF